MRSIRLREELLHRIGVREWGQPTLVMPGKISRSRERRTVTCSLPSGHKRVRWDTRSVEIVGRAEEEWMPVTWRDAIWTYCKAWPHSAWKLVPFLRAPEKERHALLRRLLENAAAADHIGIMSSGRVAGAFAAHWPIVGEL